MTDSSYENCVVDPEQEDRSSHICLKCGKSFTQRTNLTRHSHLHYPLKNYVCSFEGCRASFNTSRYLSDHKKKVHSSEKPHKCPYEGCPREFSYKQALNAHILVHTGAKPHKCPYEACDTSYRSKSELNDHLRSHTGERPYSCRLCSESFTTKKSLEQHKQSHSRGRPYKCPCGKEYKYKGSLACHQEICQFGGGVESFLGIHGFMKVL